MKKRRLEIFILAALAIFAAAERPTLPSTPIDMSSALYQVEGFSPRRIETVRDLGLVAVRLLVAWID